MAGIRFRMSLSILFSMNRGTSLPLASSVLSVMSLSFLQAIAVVIMSSSWPAEKSLFDSWF